MSKQAAIQQQFATLRANYAQQLPARFDDIENALSQLENEGEDVRLEDSALNELHRQLHSITGAAGTFGFQTLSDRARVLERLVKSWLDELSRISPLALADLRQATADLRHLSRPEALLATGETRDPPELGVEDAKPAAEQRLIYIVEDEREAAEELGAQLHHFGYETAVLNAPEDLAGHLALRRPDAVIMDISFPKHHLSGPEVLRRLNEKLAEKLPVLFTTNGSDIATRLSAVRAGGQGYFTKPLDVNALAERLELITQREPGEPYRILIVDDQSSLAQFHAAVLRAVGMVVEIVNDPLKTLEVLVPFRPELVIVDMYMPGCSGLELAQVIRQQQAYANLPIVFLSSESDADCQLEAIQCGGDEYLIKPIAPPHLVSAVQGRAMRYRTLMSLLQRDSLTGLFNHTAVKEALSRDLSQARRLNKPLALVMLDIDHFKKVNDSHGHPVGDQVIRALARLLKQRLRVGDIVGRYGGEEFVAILPGSTTTQAERVIDELRRSFQALTIQSVQGPLHCTFSAGIAEYPRHARSEELFEHADRALYAAKHAGRNCIRSD
ncbi:MAG: diguanylate cyclase [Gammaproteobacteria bacterium]|nr:diguanylate cyclase [Gammaproteobacteria bacterium]